MSRHWNSLSQMALTQISCGKSDSLHTAWSSGHFQERREKLTLISLVVGTQCLIIKVATYYWLNKSSWCHASSLLEQSWGLWVAFLRQVLHHRISFYPAQVRCQSGALDGDGQQFMFNPPPTPLFLFHLVFTIHTACIIGDSSKIYCSQRKFQCPWI